METLGPKKTLEDLGAKENELRREGLGFFEEAVRSGGDEIVTVELDSKHILLRAEPKTQAAPTKST